jgi:hypothetical protein
VADPVTGVSMYFLGQWSVAGGTSVASPVMAGVWAATGLAGTNASYIYANQGSFNDVTTGGNGNCQVPYLCGAQVGYDAPTGVGTPNGALLNQAFALKH